MAQRHAHDTVERLWPGAADRNDSRFVPVDLRDLVADCPDDVEAKMVRELYTTKSMVRTIGRRLVEIHPSVEPDDLEVALIWKKCDWARTKLHSDRRQADRATYDAANYTCSCCGEVHVPGLNRNQTTARTFSDGTRAKTCGRCAVVLEHLAVEAVGGQEVNGTTRLDAARALLARARPTL